MAYKIFVDANVYLDFFQQRGDDWKEAEAIFKLAEKKSIDVITSSSRVLNLMYVMKRYDTPQLEIIKYANAILKCSTLEDPDNRTFMTALSSGFSDLEDAVQYHTALHVKGMDHFITPNIKDFKKATSQLPVLTSKQFMKKYNG